MTDEPLPPVLQETRGHAAWLTLNRPKALNGLNHEMVLAIHAALRDWDRDAAVAHIVLDAAGERGLCAGGDIVEMYRTKDPEQVRRYFTDEYAMDHFTSELSKPYVALMDGLVLGGGVGVSAHGSHRVVTERTKLGMPETGIGFLPDVGATRLLARAPGELGTYMALTGFTITGADAVALGFADVLVPSERLAELRTRLERENADDVLRELSLPAGDAGLDSPLIAEREWIDEAFAGDDIQEILARLRAAGRGELAETIAAKAPTSTVVTLALLRRARERDVTLREALDEELRVGMRLFETGSMLEGIRAQVIDKDKNPQWQPSRLEDVDPAEIERIMA